MRVPRCVACRSAALRCASRLNAVLLCVISLAAVSGCSRGPQFGEVSGTVTLNGRPLSDLEVVFLPDPGAGTSGPTSTAKSEEHTSELQSHSDLVCRLLLEKKKTIRYF